MGSFEYLEDYLGVGLPTPEGWTPLSESALLIFVGGMGAGKSTAIQWLLELEAEGETVAGVRKIVLLPNRRDLTDRLIIAPMQREEGRPVQRLDRLAKLDYITRYQQRYPAGLAYSLATCAVKTHVTDPLYVFDGLRGDEEIPYAVQALPRARFVALVASDFVRLWRLLERNDDYDQIDHTRYPMESQHASVKNCRLCEEMGIPEAADMINLEEERVLRTMVARREITESDLYDKLRILCAERSLYNIQLAVKSLQTLAPERSLVIDTTARGPEQVSEKIISFLILQGIKGSRVGEISRRFQQ
jgi:hypothetical protein